MKRVRCGAGLGDSIYLRAVCEYFVRRGEKVTALSDWPGVFNGSGIPVDRFTRTGVDVVAHYVGGKYNKHTTQWQDVCSAAGVPTSAPLAITWEIRNRRLVDDVRAAAHGRRVVLVHGGRIPMARTDGFGAEIMPERRGFDLALDELSECFLVAVGGAEPAYELRYDMSLIGKTTVPDLIDLGAACDAIVGQCSYAVPLAEVFDKPLLAVWSARGLTAREPYVRAITPEKILSKPTSTFVFDDWPESQIRRVARAFRHS